MQDSLIVVDSLVDVIWSMSFSQVSLFKSQSAAWQPRSRGSPPRERDHEMVNTSTRGRNAIWVKGQMTLTSQIGYIPPSPINGSPEGKVIARQN